MVVLKCASRLYSMIAYDLPRLVYWSFGGASYSTSIGAGVLVVVPPTVTQMGPSPIVQVAACAGAVSEMPSSPPAKTSAHRNLRSNVFMMTLRLMAIMGDRTSRPLGGRARG